MRFHDPRLYINREISWLAFNDRVLSEAKSAVLPIYERLKFLTIVSSNLDEFFMVRVAGLKQQLILNVAETGADGLLPIMDEVYAVAARRGVEIVALPTEAACSLIADLEPRDVNAVLHITC